MYSFHFLEARDSYDPLTLSHPLQISPSLSPWALGTRVDSIAVTGAGAGSGSEGARGGCRIKGKRDHAQGEPRGFARSQRRHRVFETHNHPLG